MDKVPEKLVSDGLVYTIAPGKRLFIAFTGFATYLPDLKFEFAEALKPVDGSFVFVKNRHHVWYHAGISDEVNTIPKLERLLQDLVEIAEPSDATLIGASAGGYAAILFGHLLKANKVHAFDPQTVLDMEINEKYHILGHLPGDGDGPEFWYKELCNLHALNLDASDCFYDLKEVISPWNGVTDYRIYVSESASEESGTLADHVYANYLEDCQGVSVIRLPCSGHATGSTYLKRRGLLTKTISEI